MIIDGFVALIITIILMLLGYYFDKWLHNKKD